MNGTGDPAEPTTLSGLGEFAAIRRVTAGRRQPATTLLGPGDDAALVAAADGRTVVCTDMLVEGVHFRLDWSTPQQVGRKAAAANLADVAAMGAVPTAVLAAVGCPAQTPVSTVDGLADGIWAEAGNAGAGLVGGDLVTAAQLVVSVTAIGDLQGRLPVRRNGAQAGDVLALCGRVGWAAAGLAVLGRGFRSPLAFVDAHRVPEPPYQAGPRAADAGATSMIDVSDGLLGDVGHLAEESGVQIDITSASLELPPRMAEVASALGVEPMRWLLTGGEDHALVATFPAGAVPPDGWTVIGAVRSGSGVLVDGTANPDGGWRHFE